MIHIPTEWHLTSTTATDLHDWKSELVNILAHNTHATTTKQKRNHIGHLITQGIQSVISIPHQFSTAYHHILWALNVLWYELSELTYRISQSKLDPELSHLKDYHTLAKIWHHNITTHQLQQLEELYSLLCYEKWYYSPSQYEEINRLHQTSLHLKDTISRLATNNPKSNTPEYNQLENTKAQLHQIESEISSIKQLITKLYHGDRESSSITQTAELSETLEQIQQTLKHNPLTKEILHQWLKQLQSMIVTNPHVILQREVINYSPTLIFYCDISRIWLKNNMNNAPYPLFNQNHHVLQNIWSISWWEAKSESKSAVSQRFIDYILDIGDLTTIQLLRKIFDHNNHAIRQKHELYKKFVDQRLGYKLPQMLNEKITRKELHLKTAKNLKTQLSRGLNQIRQWYITRPRDITKLYELIKQTKGITHSEQSDNTMQLWYHNTLIATIPKHIDTRLEQAVNLYKNKQTSMQQYYNEKIIQHYNTSQLWWDTKFINYITTHTQKRVD